MFLLIASCAGTPGPGAVLLPSQPTPASLAAFLHSCQPAATVDINQFFSCAFLAPDSTFILQPGPPATLPLHTTLIGAPATGPLQPTCCGPSNGTVAPPLPGNRTTYPTPPPQPANATAASSTTTTLPKQDLSRLAPSSLVVPPNGTSLFRT